ncbi:MAG: GNAT family N-acetyltransferase [Gemmataceae bacterium]
MAAPFTIGVARPEELPAAFRLIFQTTANDDERERRLANALRMVSKGELEREGVFVARDRSGLVGAMVCLPVPGASGLVWPPQILPGLEPQLLEDDLIRRASSWLRDRGARLGQALLSADETNLGPSLQRNGFAHITTLFYLRHYLDLPVSLLLAKERLTFQTYRRAKRSVFHDVLWRTYEETQDCPEVNGVRTIDEVIIGHQSQGKYDPSRWWLAFAGETAIGVLLLTDIPEAHYWELAYVGVIPEARQHGFGRELIRKALFETRAADAGQLSLSVDQRNEPALALYKELGFEPYDEREVYLAIWR